LAGVLVVVDLWSGGISLSSSSSSLDSVCRFVSPERSRDENGIKDENLGLKNLMEKRESDFSCTLTILTLASCHMSICDKKTSYYFGKSKEYGLGIND
jgi:hypothetical protein